MSQTLKGFFESKNPGKTGTPRPYYKSSWELAFMRMCDEHPSVLQWAYEPIKIPYTNPITNQRTVYVPDFLIVFVDSKRKQKAQIIEIKPAKQTFMDKAKHKDDKMALIINAAKWEAASHYAKNHGMTFRILTEHDIFRNPK